MNPKIASERRYKATQNRLGPATDHYVNIGQTERQASMIGGGVLAFLGLLHGGGSGLALGLVGAGLLFRGYTGHCQLYAALGESTAESATSGRLQRQAG